MKTSNDMKNLSSQKSNHGKEYDIYYQGERSIYDKLYKGNIIPRDIWIIEQEIFSLCASIHSELYHNKIMKILDYGCGDGRYLQAVLAPALKLKNQGFKVELIAYDPSKVGLEKMEEKLLLNDFSKISNNSYTYIAEEVGGEKGYVSNIFQSEKHNLTVKLIHGHVEDKLEHIAYLIGNVHLTLCMYGVLSHISGRKNRIDLLKTLGDITDKGSIIVTLPGARILSEQHKVFSYLRKENYKEDHLIKAVEDGDLYYTRYEEKGKDIKRIENFYHIYTSAEEVAFDFCAAGLKPKKGIQIQKILRETTLTRNKFIAKIDEYISYTAPNFLTDYIAGYYLVIAERPKELKIQKHQSFVEKILKEAQEEKVISRL